MPIDGVPLLISFNIKLFRRLWMIKSPNVIFETNAAHTLGMLHGVGDEKFVHIIMPINTAR